MKRQQIPIVFCWVWVVAGLLIHQSAFGQDQIVVNGAIDVRTESVADSSPLQSILDSVIERIRVEAASRTVYPPIASPPSDLLTRLDTVKTRPMVRASSRIRFIALQTLPESLTVLLGQASERVRFEFASRASTISLLPIPTELEDLIATTAERIMFESASRNRSLALTYPKGIFPSNQPPTIRNITSRITGPNAVVNWSTTEFAICTLTYGTTSGMLDHEAALDEFLIEHQVQLSGLSEGAIYLGRIACRDLDEATSNSAEFELGTSSPDPTTVPTTSVPPTAEPTTSVPPTVGPTLATPTATPTDPSTPSTATPTPTTLPTTAPPNQGTADTYEENNTCDTASAIAIGETSQFHTFHQPDDLDWVTFAAEANVTYLVEVQIPIGSKADVYLELHSECGSLPQETWNETFTPGVRLEFKPLRAGSIYLRMTNQDQNEAAGNLSYALSVRQLSESPSTGAVIILAGRYKNSDPLQENIHNVTDDIHALFQANGYSADDITYLTTDSTLAGHDAAATATGLRTAIVDWAKSRVGANKPLTLYLVDHGDRNVIYIDEPNGERVTSEELDSWLAELEQAVPNIPINIMVEACHSGSFIHPNGGGISRENRVVITSSNVWWDAYASRRGAHFSDYFITSLQQGRNLFTSFLEAKNRVQNLYPRQEPWLDGDGDGRANEAEDYAVAAQRGFAYAGTLGDQWPPYIAGATGELATGQTASGILQAEVHDNSSVDSVWATIYPPSYQPPEPGNQLVQETQEVVLLQPNGEAQYEGRYSGFTEPGIYRLVIQVQDGDGLESNPVVLEIQNGSIIYLPTVMK
ncbi:MAG: C13 family peptidase [Chloroflexota bacterium]